MKICINCGVELDDGMNPCPLCGMDPALKADENVVSGNSPSSIIKLQRKENRRYLWELSGIMAFSGIVVCTIIDLILTSGLKWSLYSDVSISSAWIIITLFLFFHRRPFILSSLIIVTILAALFFTDLITSAKGWFLPVGLPLSLSAFVSAAAIIALFRVVRFRGLNFVAASLVILSGFCIITELSLDKYNYGIVDLRWSLIAAVSILPVSLIFFFYHYRLKKGNRLDSFFHV